MVAFGLRMAARAVTRRFGKSAILLAGVALAVASLVVLEAIMQGVCDAMVRNSVALHYGDVGASWPGEQGGPAAERAAERLPGVRHALLRRHREGLLVHGDKQTGVTLYGVQPDRERLETVIAHKLLRGGYLDAPGRLVLGSAAAEAIQANVNDTVQFWRKGAEPVSYRVGGIFRTSVAHLDGQCAFVRLADIAGGENELAVFLAPGTDPAPVADALRGRLPAGSTVKTWRQVMPELVQLISLDEVAMDVVQALALLILAFGVSNSVFIAVSQRTREFAVLKTMGMTPGGVELLVLAEVLGVVALAGAAGVALGAGASLVWAHWGLDLSAWTSANPHFIASGVVDPRLTARGLLLPALVAVACGLLAGALPARRAGRISVVRALRTI